MRAVEISSFGAPGVLRLGDRPVPAPGAGEVLIRVSASGVNRPDVLQRTGNYPVPPGASDIPGLEVAGVIESGDAAAMAAAGLKVGDRVCALVAGGGYAQWCVAPVGQCLPVPAGSALRVFGFVSTIEELMAASDLAVAKSGGLTTSECLALGLPFPIAQGRRTSHRGFHIAYRTEASVPCRGFQIAYHAEAAVPRAGAFIIAYPAETAQFFYAQRLQCLDLFGLRPFDASRSSNSIVVSRTIARWPTN